jgi:hypothetical protein
MARIWSGMHGIFHFQYPSASPVRHPPAGEADRYPARAAARAAALRSYLYISSSPSRFYKLIVSRLAKMPRRIRRGEPPLTDIACAEQRRAESLFFIQFVSYNRDKLRVLGAAAAVDPPFPFASIDATSWCARASAQCARDWPIRCCLAFSSTPLCQIIPLTPRCRLVFDSAAPVAHLAASRCIRAGGPAFRGLAGADCTLAGDERRVDGCIHRPAH